MSIEKVAIVNANSFARYFPEFIPVLEESVGEVERFTFPNDITAEELAEQLKGFQYIINGTSPKFSEDFFKLADDLKLIIRFGIGYDNIDVAAAERHGRMCANVPSELEKYDVAEQAVGLMVTLCKRIAVADAAVRVGEWSKDRERFLGNRIRGKVVGVIGYGNIGSAFGEIMKGGFNCEVLAYDPYIPEERLTEMGVKKVELDELLEQSDIISLHLNSTAESYHLLNAENIAKMKDTCVLVNTARGELVDEVAIAEAINAGKLGGYGADVIEGEPIKMDNPLLECKNVIITPHTSVYNLECNWTMNDAVVQDVMRVAKGEQPLHILHG